MRMSSVAIVVLCFLLVPWVLGAAAGGTTLRPMDLPEMVRAADRVVHARATHVDVHWDAGHRKILTDTTFEVIEVAKGAGPSRLTVTTLGGRIDPIEMTVDGTPAFQVGEEVVLMTTPRPDGRKSIVGFSQGAFRIREDPRTGALYVSGGPVAPAALIPRGVLPLEVFMENIRALASRGVVKPDAEKSDAAKRGMRLAPVSGPGVTP